MEIFKKLGGGFKHFLSSTLPGKMIHFDLGIFFSNGLKPSTTNDPNLTSGWVDPHVLMVLDFQGVVWKLGNNGNFQTKNTTSFFKVTL